MPKRPVNEHRKSFSNFDGFREQKLFIYKTIKPPVYNIKRLFSTHSRILHNSFSNLTMGNSNNTRRLKSTQADCNTLESNENDLKPLKTYSIHSGKVCINCYLSIVFLILLSS